MVQNLVKRNRVRYQHLKEMLDQAREKGFTFKKNDNRDFQVVRDFLAKQKPKVGKKKVVNDSDPEDAEN